MLRIITVLFLVIFSLIGWSCSNKEKKSSQSADHNSSASKKEYNTATTAVKCTLSIEELGAYNGKDGKPAYVAIDGVIYDVTKVKAWRNGTHKGNSAGNDLTEIIKNKSPHGLKVLKKLPVVGTLKSE